MTSVSDAVQASASARVLAQAVLSEYFMGKQARYPINSFQMLTDYGIPFAFRFFSDKAIEGIYLPAQNADDTSVVGINIKRPITRQRYTAAHELCHHIKDSKSSYVCSIAAADSVEKYAEAFAAELLMPYSEMKKQISLYEQNGSIALDSVLLIAEYFGVSFMSCLYRIAYTFKRICGDNKTLSKTAKKYSADKKRKLQGFTSLILYEQLIDALEPWLRSTQSEFIKAKYNNNYIYNDSRLEGIDLEKAKVSEIVTDIRLYGAKSHYCTEEYENEIAVAGHALMYEYLFELLENEPVDIYSLIKLHKRMYSCAPFPDFGGSFRRTDPLVLGAKFETLPSDHVPSEIIGLDDKVKQIVSSAGSLMLSDYIKQVTQLHHKLTVIHPFGDGNGRATRAFLNLLLIRRGSLPIYIKAEEKNDYLQALSTADGSRFDDLFIVIYKATIRAQAELSEAPPL